MAEGYDGRELIETLKKHLQPGLKVLELGMGPGKDFDILKKNYEVTGSDKSRIFLERYKKKNKEADLLQLDAINIETDRKFHCIYSNKVLHHLTKDELNLSLKRQEEILLRNGILFHTFWEGKNEEEYHGLRFVYYSIDELTKIFERNLEIIEIKKYKEMKNDDSIYVIARKNSTK